MRSTHAWLAKRRPAPPDALGERLEADTEPAVASDIPAILGNTAVRCMARALTKGSDREAALDLLAADALLTYGCEAAAEESVQAVLHFARDFGGVRLARLG